MNTLKSTFGALAAGLVLASGCNREVLGIGDYNGDGIQDSIVGNKSKKIQAIYFGNSDGTYTPYTKIRVETGVFSHSMLVLKNKDKGLCFFNGANFVFAPKWEGTLQELSQPNRVTKTQMLDSYETSKIEAKQAEATQ